MKINKSIIILSTVLTVSSPVHSEEQAPVIVTATKTSQTVDDTLSAVTVITEAEIKQKQAGNIYELLSSISGLDFTSQGGRGKLTSLFMRGTSSSHVLVMIDGVKIGSATSGTIPFENIPVNLVERIEIVRGPRSSLYGSEAVGGVIHIFTRKPTQQESASLEFGTGDFATNKIIAGVNGIVGDAQYSLSASHIKTAGIDVKKDTETDRDGYSDNSFNASVSYKINNTSSIKFNHLYSSGLNEYDGSFSNNGNYSKQTTGLSYQSLPIDNWSMKLSASQHIDKASDFLDTTFKYRYDTTRSTYSWQNDISINTDQLLTVGLEHQNDFVSSSTNYDETSRDNNALFIQHQWFNESHDFQIGFRTDDNQAFGQHNTGNIAWGYNFNKDLRIIASHGTAFKAPTFNNLYYPGGGNTNLLPENSSTSEVELRNKADWGNISLSTYSSRIENLISGWPAKNVNLAEIRGIELRFDTKIAGWDTKLELASLDPRDVDTGKVLQRRSKESLRLDIDRNFDKWSAGMSVIGQGARFDDKANNTELGGYAIVNLRAKYDISKKMSLKFKVDNLLDKEYETAKDYNNPGLSGYISISYNNF